MREMLERGVVLATEGVFGEFEAGRLSAARGLRAKGLGLVDSTLLALSARTGAEIWTLDRQLREAAGRSAFS